MRARNYKAKDLASQDYHFSQVRDGVDSSFSHRPIPNFIGRVEQDHKAISYCWRKLIYICNVPPRKVITISTILSILPSFNMLFSNNNDN